MPALPASGVPEDEQTKKERRKCHLPRMEMAQNQEKSRSRFGAGVIFERRPSRRRQVAGVWLCGEVGREVAHCASWEKFADMVCLTANSRVPDRITALKLIKSPLKHTHLRKNSL
jgi:hypothetical protein